MLRRSVRLGIIATVGGAFAGPSAMRRAGAEGCDAVPVVHLSRRPTVVGPSRIVAGVTSRLLAGYLLTAERQAVPSRPSTLPHRRPSRSSRHR